MEKTRQSWAFGLMRLPKLAGGKIDIEQTKQMVDLFMKAGLTYDVIARLKDCAAQFDR